MANVIELLANASRKEYRGFWLHPNIHKYLLTGDKKLLKTLPNASNYENLPSEVLQELGPPSKLDDVGKRLLEVCRVTKAGGVGIWLSRTISREAGGFDEFESACGLLAGMGFSQTELAVETILYAKLASKDGQVTGAGKFLVSLATEEQGKVIERFENIHWTVDKITRFLGVHATEKFKSILGQRMATKKLAEFDRRCWIRLLEVRPADFVELAERAAALLLDFEALQLMAKLAEINPAKHQDKFERLAKRVLLAKDAVGNYELDYRSVQAGLMLIKLALNNSREELRQFFAAPCYGGGIKWVVLDELIKKLGGAVLPFFEACFESPQAVLQFQALQAWINFNQPADTPRITNFFRQLLGSTDAEVVAQAICFIADWNLPLLEADLWDALGNKSRPIREAAAKVLAKLGDARLPKAAELWANKRADARLGAASWLRALGTPAAIAALKARLDDEENNDVRNAILLALESLGGAGSLSPAELKARIKITLAKITGPPVKWLAPNKLPLPRLKNGEKLDAETLLYLLYCQSRVKEMRADLEAKLLYAQIDRATSGDLALAVANAFIVSKADADDRWTLAFAALVGDDRLVPLLSRQIKDWADNMRGKLAEYGVQALALLSTDAALLAVDAMAIRYRSKNKNIGKAASEAFAAAAQARGLAIEALGDLVVPWLGFNPGEPRMVAAGKINVEVKIDGDFKLSFRDTTNNKRLAKLPDSAGAAAKAEFKDLAANLKEATKFQLLRMENLMVRQFRWPVARWQELYLRHPLLLPFAWRLVWAVYLPNGGMGETFRALEDGSLTRVNDEPLGLPKEGAIGLVHPLELTPEQRQAWVKHLADYAVTPPFPQMGRPVVLVKAEERALKQSAMVENTELNAMTFKGRAERLGWTRGSVCDAGMIPFYTKSFPGPGVDVFLGLENMFIGVGTNANVTLGKVFFVKHGSVKIGSCEYDEPGDDKDPRLVAFGVVPASAFSEAMGDLVKIAGKSATPTEEPA